MENKCPNCGFNYGEFDVYCARCGRKLHQENADIKTKINDFVKKTPLLINKKNTIEKERKPKKSSFNFLDNALIKFALFLFVSSVILALTMIVVLNKHEKQKEKLDYKSLITNPSQIPYLKDFESYNDIELNFRKTQNFLEMYLKFSKDSKEKKEQIFLSYLNEADKLQNISTKKLNEEFNECQNLDNKKNIKTCTTFLNEKFKNTGIKVYNNEENIYLYQDNKFIQQKYLQFFNDDIKKYINLNAKYNKPVSLGLNLYISPQVLSKKIIDTEMLLLANKNEYLKEKLEKTLLNDTKKLIFAPQIYATTTKEIQKEFKNTYINFTKNKKSALTPLFLSVLDKQRAYNETNFKNDYPYKTYKEEDFNTNVKKSAFNDIFAQLRKNIFSDENSDFAPAYVYNVKNAKWENFKQNHQLQSGEFVISEPDENNNVSIYNHMYSPLQEMNILKYSKLYLINDNLYTYNQDKLSISKITFNGKTFNLYNLTPFDITSLFPGIEIINMDSYSNYDIHIEKDNSKANYIIISRYSQGWSEYNIEQQNGEIKQLILPNMFSVDSKDEIVLFLKAKENEEDTIQEEISQNTPSYKITIHTRGQKPKEIKEENKIEKVIFNDNNIDLQNPHTPNIMPKLPSYDKENEDEIKEDLPKAPQEPLDIMDVEIAN